MKKYFQPPQWVRKETKIYMKQICSQLEELGLLDSADTGGLMMICADYELLLKSLDEINDPKGPGLFDTTPQGKTVPSAAFVTATTAQTQLIKLLREYGLTSKTRASLRKMVPPAKDSSPLERLIDTLPD